MSPDSGLASLVADLDATDLAELERTASLQTRFDRKYLLSDERSADLLRSVGPDVAVLRIDGASALHHYETRYFDTAGHESYLGTARRRRKRFKVRIRTYTDSGLCMLEVKCKGGRGETVKVRMSHPSGSRTHLDDVAAQFVDTTIGRPGLAAQLHPVLTTSFHRMTLLDRRDGSRATLDHQLTWTTPVGSAISLERHMILETKSVGAATDADRWLWRHGSRPITFSKFCIGMALQDPELPANKWNRTLRQTFGWEPHRDPRRAVDTIRPDVTARAMGDPVLAHG
jgi:hypothetical protein